MAAAPFVMIRGVCFDPSGYRNIESFEDEDLKEHLVQAAEKFAYTGIGKVKKLQGSDGDFRLRVGKWRICFYYDEGYLVIFEVSDRKDAYR
jgi:mRNA interferase RelE/StbE